jgi:hypothetical protein
MAKITQVFASNTTWTVPARCYFLEVFMIGGGGGGGADARAPPPDLLPE